MIIMGRCQAPKHTSDVRREEPVVLPCSCVHGKQETGTRTTQISRMSPDTVWTVHVYIGARNLVKHHLHNVEADVRTTVPSTKSVFAVIMGTLHNCWNSSSPQDDQVRITLP